MLQQVGAPEAMHFAERRVSAIRVVGDPRVERLGRDVRLRRVAQHGIRPRVSFIMLR